jgi:hypothetical protein
MTISKEVLTTFAKEKNNVFPWSAIKKTRNAYHTKWLLFRANSVHGISNNRTRGFFVLPTAALPSHQVQLFIVTETAFPLPPDHSEIVDSMEWQGRSIDPEWEQDIFQIFWNDFFNRCDTYGNRQQLFYHSIGLLVKQNVRRIAGSRDEYLEMLWIEDAFKSHFHTLLWRKESHDFFYLTMKSICFVNIMICRHLRNKLGLFIDHQQGYY